MKEGLDNLVAANFKELYLNFDSKRYYQIWGEISGELYQKYDLIDISCDDSDYELKCKKEHCIHINMRIYLEKEFPWELFHKRVYRFVKQYGKLPKQAPDEWNDFESDEREQAGIERRKSYEAINSAVREFERKHPEYAG